MGFEIRPCELSVYSMRGRIARHRSLRTKIMEANGEQLSGSLLPPLSQPPSRIVRRSRRPQRSPRLHKRGTKRRSRATVHQESGRSTLLYNQDRRLAKAHQFSEGGDKRKTHTLDKAAAVPHADPLMFVGKISGVHPYNIAHITLEAKAIPTVVDFNKKGSSTFTNTAQKKAVRKVLPAKDHRRPKDDSIR